MRLLAYPLSVCFFLVWIVCHKVVFRQYVKFLCHVVTGTIIEVLFYKPVAGMCVVVDAVFCF